MDALDFNELEQRSRAFDALVRRSPEIDRFCSSTPWILSAREAISPDVRPFIRVSEEGYLAFMTLDLGGTGRTLLPLEASWGLACPLVGTDPRTLAFLLEGELSRSRAWDTAVVAGIPRDGAWFQTLVRHLVPLGTLGIGNRTVRRVASLRGGFDGFLSRRSPRFRRFVRRARKRARSEGLGWEYEHVTDPARARVLYRRAMRIEGRSWKGRQGVGINKDPMCGFYDRMLQRLSLTGGLRMLFLVRDGVDLAFGFGAVLGDSFRGLQMSYDLEHATLAPGNLVQSELVKRLAREGVRRYDLGTEMAYKARWGELEEATVALILHRD